MITAKEFEQFLPLACAWAEEQETVILRDGVALTPGQITDARNIGVAKPERVRLRVVEEIPMPAHPGLRKAAELTGLISALTIGLTLRYGIFIQAEAWGERRIVIHELVHTLQYERLGGFTAFLRQYLQECLSIGYPDAPLEQEARRIEREMCGS